MLWLARFVSDTVFYTYREGRNAQLDRFLVRTKVAALDLTQSYAYREIAGGPENSGFPTPALLTQHGNNFHVPS